MRRRIRSAAFPLHRHSLPQLAVDGALVALAYYLAFELRFNNGPTGYYSHLRERHDLVGAARQPAGARLLARLPAPLALLGPARLRGRRARGRGDRAADVVAVAVLRPVERVTVPRDQRDRAADRRDRALRAALRSCFLIGVRALARAVTSAARWRPSAAGARDERSVLIVGAGDGGRLVLREIVRNRELGLAPVGFVDDDPLKRGCGSTACACAATRPRSCRASSTTPSPTK